MPPLLTPEIIATLDKVASDHALGKRVIPQPVFLDGTWLCRYEKGGVVASPLYGAVALAGSTMSEWWSKHRRLGPPATHSATAAGVPHVACQHGDLYVHATAGAVTVMGSMRTAIQNHGDIERFGPPVAEACEVLTRGGVILQMFERTKLELTSTGQLSLLPRFPLCIFAANGAVIDKVPIQAIVDSITFPGIHTAPEVHSFQKDLIGYIAIWLHPIDEQIGVELVKPLTRPPLQDWSLTVARPGVEDAVAMYLSAIDHKVDVQGIHADINALAIAMSSGSTNTAAVELHVTAHVKKGSLAADATIDISDSLTPSKTGSITTDRSVDIHTSDTALRWLVDAIATAFAAPFGAGGATTDAFINSIVHDDSFDEILKLGDLIPLPREFLIPNTRLKARLAAETLVVVDAPSRFEIGGALALVDRVPLAGFNRVGNLFTGVSKDMREPEFSWSFNWTDVRPTGEKVFVTLPTTDPGDLHVWVTAVDKDGVTASHDRAIKLADVRRPADPRRPPRRPIFR